jgi:NhaP-type Na+/H+ or K+/H+ antiporter
MAQRLAAVAALIVFSVCLLIGGFGAGNPFITAVERALVAMAATLGLGLIVGWMAQKMLDENIEAQQEHDKTAAAGALASAGGANPAAGPTTGESNNPVPVSASPRARAESEAPGKK